MRRLLPQLCALVVLATGPALAQDAVQEFSGSGSTTTGFFKTGDRWEVRWNARQAISVAALTSGGAIVAGGSGVLRGSLFVPAGGQYYLKITDGTTAPAPPATNASPVATTHAPATPSAPADKPAETAASWHVQIVQLSPTVASTDALTVYTPYFIVPDAAVTSFTPLPPPPPPTLTPDQLRAMVTIKGDNAQGNGFLVRSADGVFVAAHLHLLAANPNLTLFSGSGAPIKVLSVKAATDRDLAFIAVQDDHFSCLPLPAAEGDDAVPGDQVIVPVLGDPAAPLGQAGKVIDLSADRIDFDVPLNIASLGAPLIHVKEGAVLGIATAEKRVDLTDDIAKAWPANPAPGSSTIFPYYGLRLKSVAGWEPLALDVFQSETAFLQQFHETTRCLDSYLNGHRHRSANGNSGPAGPPDNRYYSNNAKLVSDADTYKKFASGADHNQSLDAARELLCDLQAVADTDVDRLKGLNSAYNFNRTHAQEELAYRKAIKDELDKFSDNIPKFDVIARSR
jgi:hypothetical protein